MEEETKESEMSNKKNPFLDRLRNNQVEQARSALLKTICQNTGQTIGSIIDALEEEKDGDYIMMEIFRGLSLDEIFDVMAKARSNRPAPSSSPAAEASVKNLDDDDDDDDDDEFEDDDLEEDEPEESESKPKPEPSTKAPKKKKNKEKKDKKSKKSDGKSKAKSGDGSVSKESVLACLKAAKARDEDSAISSEAIRDETGGSAEEIRPILKELLDEGEIDKTGAARGTRYHLV